MENEAPKITLRDKEYLISELSNAVNELLSLHGEAHDKMLKARRQAAIYEIASQNLAHMVANKVEAEEAEAAEAEKNKAEKVETE